MTTVVRADDEALLHKAMAALLPLEGEITVLADRGRRGTGRRGTARRGGVDGLGTVAQMRQAGPEQVVLMLTCHARPGVLRKAVRPGVQGSLSRSAEPADITSVIATLREGKRWIDPDVSALAVIDDCRLTDRELCVLRVTGNGFSAAE